MSLNTGNNTRNTNNPLPYTIHPHQILHSTSRLHKIKKISEALISFEVKLAIVEPDVFSHFECDEEI